MKKKAFHGNDNKDFVDGKPTIEYVKQMRTSYSEMTNQDILHLSSEGDHNACKESLLRNIMAVDSINYDDAKQILSAIVKVNRSYMIIHVIPYQVGVGVSLAAAIISVPLVFQYDAALYVHDAFITADVPQPKDLETPLEIGSWSWAWMEPVLGQISFVLLTLQFTRGQLLNMGFKPYGGFVKQWRAKKVIELYPNYDPELITKVIQKDSMH